jgi:hypothetical protein
LSDYVSKRLRAVIVRRANGCCEYCGCPAKFCIDPFVAEHIQPIAKGGLSAIDNLAFACMGCNGFKQDKTQAYDATSQAIAPLYNPRTHVWHEHFAWNEDYTRLVPLTAIGRVTIAELQLNREGAMNIRMLLTLAGLHPSGK